MAQLTSSGAATADRPFPPGAYPVVVVGSGPGGLQLSYALDRLGVRHAVISADDAPGVHDHPGPETGATVHHDAGMDQAVLTHMDVVAENELGERVMATPAIVGNTIYVRTDKHLFAFHTGAH